MREIKSPGRDLSKGIPETTIFYNPETGCYGFSTRYPGRHMHHMIDTFDSVEQVLNWCDPQRERIWEEASDADETNVIEHGSRYINRRRRRLHAAGWRTSEAWHFCDGHQ